MHGDPERFALEHHGRDWLLRLDQNSGDSLVITAAECARDRRGIHTTLTVRRGDALAFRDRVNLTAATARRRVLAALARKDISLTDKALVALEEACRTSPPSRPSRPPGANGESEAAIEASFLSALAGAAGSGAAKLNVAGQLVALAEDMECWHTPDGEAYVTAPIEAHSETYPVRSRALRTLLEHRYYSATARAAGSDVVAAALGVLEGRARFDGPEQAVAVRLAEHQGAIYLDLADSTWRVVEVTPAGWQLCDHAPIHFRRPRGLRALPTPVAGGSVDELREWINIASDTDWQLCVGWLLAAFRPTGPYPVLALHGEHGAAKEYDGANLAWIRRSQQGRPPRPAAGQSRSRYRRDQWLGDRARQPVPHRTLVVGCALPPRYRRRHRHTRALHRSR
jgi:hypothetical protein